MGKKEALLDIVHSIDLYFMSMKPVGSTFRCEMSPITSSGHPLARERERSGQISRRCPPSLACFFCSLRRFDTQSTWRDAYHPSGLGRGPRPFDPFLHFMCLSPSRSRKQRGSAVGSALGELESVLGLNADVTTLGKTLARGNKTAPFIRNCFIRDLLDTSWFDPTRPGPSDDGQV